MGFGSSLRMSRRRGWEDAYLDYRSLRLLLTQIEAVYEEEDWKRGRGGGSGDQLEGRAASDDEDGDCGDGGALPSANAKNGNRAGWKRLWGNAWRATRAVVTGKSHHRYTNSGGRCSRRRYSRRVTFNVTNTQASAMVGGDNGHSISNNSSSNNWLSNDYFDYSPEYDDGDDHRKRKKDKRDSHDRALDRGGWRSPGVTDYRDELFLVSDEDVAYGYCGEDGNSDDEWEDEEDTSLDEGDQQYYDSGEVYYDRNVDNVGSNQGYNGLDEQERFLLPDNNQGDWSDSKRLTPGSEKLENDDTLGGGDQEPHRDCISLSVQDNSINTENMILETSRNSQNSPSTEKKSHRVQFSDSPGVLEAGYETFAAAAARSGFLNPCRGADGGQMTMTDGSPTEEQKGGGGWLDLIPNLLLSRGGMKQQQKAPLPTTASIEEIDPLLLNHRESPEQILLRDNREEYSPLPIGMNPSSSYGHVAADDDSPHRYAHFSERFHSHQSSSEPHWPYSDLPPDHAKEERNTSFSQLTSSLNEETPMNRAANLENVETSMTVGVTALGNMPPLTPMTPPMTSISEKLKEDRGGESSGMVDNIGGFGVSLKMIPTESTELLVRSPSDSFRKPQLPAQRKYSGMSQFYSFQNEDELNRSSDVVKESRGRYSDTQQYNNVNMQSGEYDGVGEEEERGTGTSNMISFYSGGKDGHFSVRSPTRMVSRRRHHTDKSQHASRALPSLHLEKKFMMGDVSGGNFILSLLFGHVAHDSAGNKTTKMSNQGRHRGGMIASGSSSNEPIVGNHHHSSAALRQKRAAYAAAAAKRKRARLLRRQRRQRRLRRRDRVPEHLRVAHVRAAAITERFRGLLRAEVEKVILFANSRLGELSDTIGSLRYSSYEESHKEYPSLADGGMHHTSSSDSDGDDMVSCASLPSDDEHVPNQGLEEGDRDYRTFSSDLSGDETKKQIILRDRLRISRPMFQKADFLGEEFSLLSAVDEADAYAAVGVELMHLLKYVCVNIIAARKICKKHDRLLSNRMLGGYYHSLTAEAKRSHNSRNGEQHHLFQLSEARAQPQFGGMLSNPTASQQHGYILGIYDTKIQHIANSTTMQTVSSSLAIALSDFEASQSRSALFGPKSEKKGSGKAEPAQHEVPSPMHQTFTTSRLRDVSGQCFRGDDDSSIASHEDCVDENASTSSNTALTRLQFVVTSIFGLREAARFKTVPFEHYSSRLFMISSGPNVTGDGLDGCSRETLDFLCQYNPDAAYTLDMETIYTSLKVVGQGNDGIGCVMVASLAAAAKGYDRKHVAAAMSINPQATGEENDAPSFRNVESEYHNILRLNTISMILYLANYYIIFPTVQLYSTSLGARSSAALIIGAANVSSVLSSLIHSLLMSKRNSFIRKHTDLSNFRLPLALCSAFAIVGNILYSYSLTKASLGMALVGRLFVGFGSAEILNRQLLFLVYPQESINTEVASLAKMSMITIALALVFGSVPNIKVMEGLPLLTNPMLSIIPSPTPSVNISLAIIPAAQPFLPPLPLDQLGQHSLFSLESIGYVMSFAWLIHLIGMVLFFHPPKSKRKAERAAVYPNELKVPATQEADFDSDTETYEQEKNLPHVSIEANPFIPATRQEISHGDGTFEKLQTMSRKNVKHQYQHTFRDSINNVRSLMFSNVAFPTTVAVLFIVKIATEVLLSSCGSITSRYFKWSGTRAGLFTGFMASMILPVNMSLATERNFTERRIMKIALETGRLGFWLMLDYESLFLFVVSIVKGVRKKDLSTGYQYDGFFGAPQYILSFAIVFFSIITLESVTLTLMSKVQVAPRKMKKYSIDNAFMVIFVSALGRLVGDIFLFAVDVSSWTFVNDMVNSLCISLIIAFTAGLYIVKKHYFFLI